MQYLKRMDFFPHSRAVFDSALQIQLINVLFIHALSITRLIYKAIQFLKSQWFSFYHIDMIHVSDVL